jgi:DNA-binding beta-propeller fold protein YncE
MSLLKDTFFRRLCFRFVCTSALAGCCIAAAQAPAPAPSGTPPANRPPRVAATGVNRPGISRPLADLHPGAVFPVAGSPDWSVVTNDAVWVASARLNHVVQLLPATNTVGLTADVKRPCSGLADGFGSIWVPSCSDHVLVRLDPATAKPVATIPVVPANSEGGITIGEGSVWIVAKPSTLVRIDPATNKVTASIELPSGSENPFFADGFVWVSSFEHDSLLKVDPKANRIVATIPVGPKPRFLTAGAGSIWTLNQGDGTITRVDEKTGKMVASIPCGLQGEGGEIAFGAGYVWAALFDFPLTQVDPKTNAVVKQWAGKGGDGVRFGHGSVWLSNLMQQNVWRIPSEQN